MSIEEQKRYLSEGLELEHLRIHDKNREDIKSFSKAKGNDSMAKYLIDRAWEDDLNRNTKVFLIRDKETKEIVFYFAINCGILFSDPDVWKMSSKEKEAFDKYVDALSSRPFTDATNDKVNETMYELLEILGKDYKRMNELINLAELKADRLVDKNSEEGEYIQQVKETFPAIDIKFFARNGSYQPKIKLDFKLGIYVFWEIIVPQILEIAEKVGCKYVYLFAADESENFYEDPKENQEIPWSKGYEPDDEISRREKERKLVDYYTKELKFTYISEYKVLKPDFERGCITLFQKIDDLETNRQSVWESHIL